MYYYYIQQILIDGYIYYTFLNVPLLSKVKVLSSVGTPFSISLYLTPPWLKLTKTLYKQKDFSLDLYYIVILL